MKHVKETLVPFLEKIPRDGICIDATLGNGNDCLYLLQKVIPKGFLYGFDIQEIAIQHSYEKLRMANVPETQYQLILDSHEHFNKYIFNKVNYICYNLGYLPKGNKCIATNAKVVWNSINEGLNLLVPGGLISIMLYPGHILGSIEYSNLIKRLRLLDQRRFSVLKINFENQRNFPPELVLVQKI